VAIGQKSLAGVRVKPYKFRSRGAAITTSRHAVQITSDAEQGARVCAVAIVIAVLAFTGWQLLMPASFVSVRGLNLAAVVAWRAWFGMMPSARPMSFPVYASVFRAFLIVAWAAYGGLLWFIARGATLSTRWTWSVAVPLVALLTFAQPPSLSTDVFAYVGYGRLAVVHGLNPYLHTQADLVRLGDPTGPYLHWPIPSPYGPLWTLISIAVVFLAPAGSLLGTTVALKICAGVAVLAAAAAARAIVRRTDASRASAVFVAVVLNPLLLIEGPGNGHNDLVMVALLLTGFAALARQRTILAAVLVGLAAAVKLLPLLVVPWIAVLAVRAAPPSWRHRAGAAMLMLALSIAPVVLAYAPFWSGARTLAGVAERWRLGDSSGGPAADSPQRTAAGNPNERVTRGSTRETIKAAASSVLRVASRAWPAVLIYLWASLALALGRGDATLRLPILWCCVALGILFVAGLWFPWYLAWLWPLVVLRFTRLHTALIVFALPFSLLLVLAYATPPG
jgi:alpha-1,6-mannosyltransferase